MNISANMEQVLSAKKDIETFYTLMAQSIPQEVSQITERLQEYIEGEGYGVILDIAKDLIGG